jgi:hypothetical protein
MELLSAIRCPGSTVCGQMDEVKGSLQCVVQAQERCLAGGSLSRA